MPRLSIARSLVLALVGLTLGLAVVAGLGVGSLYDARRDFEDDLARTYAAEVATANLLAAAVVEEAVLRSARADRDDRRRARAAFGQALRGARAATRGDSASEALLDRVRRQAARARQAAPPPDAGPRRRARALPRVSRGMRAARGAAADLADRQEVRRAAARERVSDRSRRAMVAAAVAAGLAILAALALVVALVARMRRPLADLLSATRGLAGGELGSRVEARGPAELQELAGAFNAMAGELSAAQQRIEAGRRRLAATIASLGDALVICDARGRVVEANPRAGELVPELRPGRDATREGPLPPLTEALDREVLLAHRERTLSVTAARIGSGPDDGVVWTVRDVTERAQLERAKSEFVATASHELRSPLTSIKGFVELLAAGDLPDRQREFVDVILLSTNRLVDLVSDLLDVARAEAGQLEVQKRPIAVGEAVEEVAELMRPRVEARRQALEVGIAPALPPAHADPARVRQIVTNLLTNAHLYTPEGGRIAVRVGAHGRWVTLTVADDGPGMTRDQQERVFERFYRGDGAQGSAGTGLGMSIVRSLVDLHDGEIDLVSAPGEGTTVIVRLPRAGGDALGAPRAAVRGRRVLVVEDDPQIARLIVEQLASHGVDVAVAASAGEAVERLVAEPFDAVTLDMLLGDTTGFEVLDSLRRDPDLGRIPVVVVSVLAGDHALAGEWSISKPIDADELIDAIGAAILAGRARVLVVGRAALRGVVGEMLEGRGVDHLWATSAAEAARLCEAHRFEVALVDAGMRSPQAALSQLDLRGRRLRRSVVLFSAGDVAPGLARLQPEPVPLEDAVRSVVEALSERPPGGTDHPTA